MMKKNDRAIGYILVLPAMLLIALFFAYPFFDNLIASFSQGNVLNGDFSFAGVKNYAKVLRDPVFGVALRNTAVWTVSVTLLQFAVGFSLALICSRKIRGLSLLRPIFILPWAIPGVVAALAWKWIYNTDFGVLNLVLRNLGLISQNISWLTTPHMAMLAAILMSAWKGSPFYLMMLYAAIEGVPRDLYEAGEIDGANALQRFRNITIPQIAPVIAMSLTLGTIWTLNAYENIFALTGGGPSRQTETLPLYIYSTAFTYFRMNDAVVPSILLFCIILLLAALYLFVQKKGENAS